MSRNPVHARPRVPHLGLGVLCLVVAACGSSYSGGRSTAAKAGVATSSTLASDSSGTVITATETEYHIALSRTTASPGPLTFEVENAGTVTHDLVVDGPGVDQRKTALLAPGQTVQLLVTVRAGTYDVYCGIPGHKEVGMDAKLTVS